VIVTLAINILSTYVGNKFSKSAGEFTFSQAVFKRVVSDFL
jgi:hypothetical protein